MKGKSGLFGSAAAFLLAVAVVLAAAFYPRRQSADAREAQVVRVWNVDTFEGGKGSRTSFLKAAARRVEREREGTFYLVSSYTLEGASEAFRAGDSPDVLSFGIGLSCFAERSLPLPYGDEGGSVGGKTLAVSWCRGGYALFSLQEDFSEAGKTAISVGGKNLPAVAARLAGIEGEELASLTAYTAFLQGEYRYLLGTQRDLCRFRARGVEVFSKELGEFSDLYQYVSVLSAEKREACLALVAELLSERTQAKLDEIGMYPAGGEGAKRTVGAFASDESLSQMLAAARSGDAKKLDKYLKII